MALIFQMFGLNSDEADRVINFMLYYGFLGVSRLEEEPTYIYDVNYDIEMLKVSVRKWADVHALPGQSSALACPQDERSLTEAVNRLEVLMHSGNP